MPNDDQHQENHVDVHPGSSFIIRDEGPGEPLVILFSNGGALTEIAWSSPADLGADESAVKEHFRWLVACAANWQEVPVIEEANA